MRIPGTSPLQPCGHSLPIGWGEGRDEGHFRSRVALCRVGDWKLLEFFEDQRVELFNLKDDPGEQSDLARKMPEKAAELHQRLQAWRASVNAAMPAPNPDFRSSPRP